MSDFWFKITVSDSYDTLINVPAILKMTVINYLASFATEVTNIDININGNNIATRLDCRFSHVPRGHLSRVCRGLNTSHAATFGNAQPLNETMQCNCQNYIFHFCLDIGHEQLVAALASHWFDCMRLNNAQKTCGRSLASTVLEAIIALGVVLQGLGLSFHK